MKRMAWSGLSLLVPAAFITVACSSAGGGGGGVACNDAGTCDDPGLVCVQGSCVAPEGGLGGGGAVGGGGGVGGGGMGGMGGGGMGGMAGGGMGGMAGGGTGGMAGGGGFGGGSGGFGGGSGGGGSCQTTIQNKKCADVLKTTAPCGACAQTNCCSTVNACLADATCAGLFQCVFGTCATASDVDTCVSQSCPGCATTSAQTAFMAIDTCLNSYCSSECQ